MTLGSQATFEVPGAIVVKNSRLGAGQEQGQVCEQGQITNRVRESIQVTDDKLLLDVVGPLN